MGRRGPKPTPTNILAMRGSPVARARKDEPRPPEGEPVMPEWLEGEARAEWERLIPLLGSMGVLSRIDGSALAALCQSWGEYRRYTAVLSAEGAATTNARGNVTKHPAATVQQEAFGRWAKLMREFGLTPAARVGLAHTKSSDDENRGKGRFVG